MASSAGRPPPRAGGAAGPPAPPALMRCSQNLPAVLNDPGRGKQRDFLTRSWGEAFNEHSPIAKSAGQEINVKHFDRYLRRLRKHAKKQPAAAAARQPVERTADVVVNAAVSPVFLDPNFDLTKPETFRSIFKFSGEANFSEQVESIGRLAQEKLSHQLDQVEVNIARQVAQKSHHFFQVMTYHDALMTQLKALVRIVRTLRAKLKTVDEADLKPSLEVCRLQRRLENATRVADKLSLMSFLHQTQPTIQLLLTSSEFSGALDLITTSCEILAVDLKGLASFRHLTSQLQEIKAIIGKILLQDFQSFIEAEMSREITSVKATSLGAGCESETNGDLDYDQLRSVIFGLLRQNSYSFLESLEEASVNGVKSVMRSVVTSVASSEEESLTGKTVTSLVADFAKDAKTEEWFDLFDLLTGSLLVFLHRIHTVQKVIEDAIKTANDNAEDEENKSVAAVIVPEAQLNVLLTANREVLINVCEQMHERCAKLLAQRSRPGAAGNIQLEELTSIGMLVTIFCEESVKKSGKQCTGLQLSLQSQTVLYVQSFHERQRNELSQALEKETWRRSNKDFSSVVSRLQAVPALKNLFTVNLDEMSNGHKDNQANGKPQLPPGQLYLEPAERYIVFDSIPFFLNILVEYCNLCSMLPPVTVELGLKTAELVKFFNSRVCQLILGAGAISVSGLKTITIRNLALALRSIQLVVRVIPHVLVHFQSCYADHKGETKPADSTPNGHGPCPSPTPTPRAETKQFEVLQRQFDQAVKHLKNHAEEIYQKVISVVSDFLQPHLVSWKPGKSVPSPAFRALCKQLAKLLDSTQDVWETELTRRMITAVHSGFLDMVRAQIRARPIPADSPAARTLQSELVFYGHSMLRHGILDENDLGREAFEQLWDTKTTSLNTNSD